jgi:hypothetical protein
VPSAGDPQSHNRYSYVRNNPVKYIDPTGHSFFSFLGSIFGGIMKAFTFVTKYVLPAFRLAGGVLELMGGGGSLLSSLQSIAGGMSSFIKNSQFQFASQVFGFFGGGAGATPSSTDESSASAIMDSNAGGTPSAAFSSENPYGFSIMQVADNDTGSWIGKSIPALGGPAVQAMSREGLTGLGYAREVLDKFDDSVYPIIKYVTTKEMTGFRYYDGAVSVARSSWLTTIETVKMIESSGLTANAALALPSTVGANLSRAAWIIPANTELLIGRIKDGAAWAVQIYLQNPHILQQPPYY